MNATMPNQSEPPVNQPRPNRNQGFNPMSMMGNMMGMMGGMGGMGNNDQSDMGVKRPEMRGPSGVDDILNQLQQSNDADSSVRRNKKKGISINLDD